jgi:hypothetical protein
VARRAREGGPSVVVGRRDEELLCLGDLMGQRISSILLVLPSEGSCADMGLALYGRCPGGGERSCDCSGVGARWRCGEGRGPLN